MDPLRGYTGILTGPPRQPHPISSPREDPKLIPNDDLLESEEVFGLTQYLEIIRDAIMENTPAPAWIVAEIAEISRPASGHVYLTLVEHADGALAATIRGTIWANQARSMVPAFESATNQKLARGITLLVACSPNFHPRYGLSLTIQAIDHNYTLGALAAERRRTIERLRSEGLIGLNATVPFPLVPQRVAVISSATAAGYGDFMARLATCAPAVVLSATLFGSSMQGDRTEAEVTGALEQIARRADEFDVVVIIRGGGSATDLQCFDSYGIAAAVARCPLPVIAGVGHQRDDSVTDLTAAIRADTPSTAAQILINAALEYVAGLDRTALRIATGMRVAVTAASAKADWLAAQIIRAASAAVAAHAVEARVAARRFAVAASLPLQAGSMRLAALEPGLRSAARRRLERSSEELARCELAVHLLDPACVLKRGYSITRVAGRVITDGAALGPGEMLHTTFHRGSVESRITQIEGTNGD